MKQNAQKPMIIFLHGWGGRADRWEVQQRFFQKKGYATHAMTLPGFDLPEPSMYWGIPEFAKYVVKHLPESKNGYIFVGHSFGGRIGMYLACHYPEYVKKLVLTDAAGLILKPTLGLKLRRDIVRFVKSVNAKLPKFIAEQIRMVVRKVIGSRDYKEATPVMREIMKNVVNLDLRYCLPKIKAPTLVVWGSNDQETPIAMAHILHKEIKGAKLHVVHGARHAPYRTHSDEWNQVVLNFLES